MPHGLSEEEVEYSREGYRLFAEGDPALWDRFSPDCAVVVSPALPGGGSFDNLVDAMEFFQTVTELWDDPRPEPEEMFRVDDCLFVLGTWRARSRSSGEPVEARFAHVWRFGDSGELPFEKQKIVAFENFIDSGSILRGLDGPASG